MRRLAIAVMTLAAAVAGGCGSPDKRLDCGGPGECPAGFFCAAEGVCWPDSTPPQVGSVAASCAAPCARDGANGGDVLNGTGCATGDAAMVPPAVNAAGNLAFAAFHDPRNTGNAATPIP